HAVWEMPAGDCNYSMRWQQIKSQFTRQWLQNGGLEGARSKSRQKQSERGVWQRRFYEHTCRDESDMKRCLDYLHLNPVKHGLVSRVRDWPWSTFHKFVRNGEYPIHGGSSDLFYGDEFKNFE
ncbi:MAG: transposase, partial [Planctomycetaceae bacterium]|nr:transposase [Planctomycetaceae bacterium]